MFELTGPPLTSTSSGARTYIDTPAVFRVRGASKCQECKADIKPGDFVKLTNGQGICTVCGKVDGLTLLCAGNTKLTLLAKRYSSDWHIVHEWNRVYRRYCRIGVLVQPDALERALCIIRQSSARLTD